MADFRRIVTALAVLALLTGFGVTANAQITGNAFSCIAQAAVPPLLRAEGVTELVGDIVLNCSGGVPIPAGSQIPTANFQVFVGNTTVTSRPNEPLLLVDEPGTSLNPAPPAVFTLPPAGGQGCGPLCGLATGPNPIPNVYQGVVSGNSVTFIGVPINPPGTTGFVRIFRMTNVRINASAIGSGAGFSGSQVLAFTSISGSTSVPVNNPQQVVGFVQPGMAFSVSGALSVSQCSNLSASSNSISMKYAEGFATSFKTQVAGTTGSTVPTQTIPGAVYNTESGLTLQPLVPLLPANEGLADFGTRLRATFRNIPTGVSVYVSTGQTSGSTTGASAVLVASESAGNASLNTPFKLTKTDTFSVDVYKLTVDSAGTAVAVWEVQNVNPLVNETLEFRAYFGFTANPANNIPAQGVQGTVSGAFAPTSTTSSSSSVAPIPRFVDLSTPKNAIIANICRTSLLYPFVSAANGFDTGLAIANTSDDGGVVASPQSGTCTLNFFGDSAPSPFTTPTVNAGKVYANVASALAPGFQGYVIARCNFQYAHGFAFVQSTVGYTPSTTAMGYLALVLTRLDPVAEALDQ